MFKIKKTFFTFLRLYCFNDKQTNEKYVVWQRPSRSTQIASVALLTALLYIFYALIDTIVAPEQTRFMMMSFHLYIIAPILLLISLLAYRKRYFPFTDFLLILAPIGAAIFNMIIVSHLEENTTYLTESYLILFWTFTISGLNLSHATISATLTFIIVLVSTYVFIALPKELFLMHAFWMISSFSFGFLGAYLIEKSNRTMFLNHEELESLASTDRLTKLYNRSKLDELLHQELDRSRRFHHTFCLLFLDIDYFKLVNDTYGHQVGDEVLVTFAHLIKEHTRSTDIIARWGGEEFIIIYLETELSQALLLADELRQNIEKHMFKSVGDQTASIGVTVYKEGDTMTALIQRADKALYLAKEKGRNSIVSL